MNDRIDEIIRLVNKIEDADTKMYRLVLTNAILFQINEHMRDLLRDAQKTNKKLDSLLQKSL